MELNTKATKVVWMNSTLTSGPAQVEEEIVEGVLQDAVNFIRGIANEATFLLGQILAMDGRVVATVAPGGVVKLNNPR